MPVVQRLYFVCPKTKKTLTATITPHAGSELPSRIEIICHHCKDLHTYSRSDVQRSNLVSQKSKGKRVLR